MKWSLVIGRFWGTEVRLHASLLLLIPYAVLMFRPVDFGQAVKMLLLLAATFICVALHEMGHTTAARMVGISVNSIVLWPLGGFANLSRRPASVLHDIFISAAGPFVNLLIFFIFIIPTLVVFLAYQWTDISRSVALMVWFDRTIPFVISLMIANLALLLFNLLPIYPLDGGQILRNLIKLVFGEKRADQVMLVLSLPPALALAVLGFVLRDVIVVLTGLILLLAALSLNPRVVHGLILGFLYVFDRAGYYYRRQDFDPALAEYNKAIARKPNAPGLYASRAICYMSLMDLAAAKCDADRALELDEKNFIAWALRGELLAMENAYPEVLAAYNKVIELQPHWAIVFLDRGRLFQEHGQFDLALLDMDHALEMSSGTGIGHVLRSSLHFEMGNVEKARADAVNAFRYAPHWMLAFPEIFLCNFVGHMDWAADYYTRAIEQMPGAYQAYQGRADAARVNGRPAWAVPDYTRAIELEPRQGELYLNRARAYLDLGETRLAEQDLQQAIRLADRAHIRRQAQEMLGTVSKTP